MSSVKRYTKIALRNFDRTVKRMLDEVLPTNLTFRYIAGLGAVAVIAVAGQILIQSSLSRQGDQQRAIRVLDRRILISEELRKAVLSLQLSSVKAELNTKMANLLNFAQSLKTGSIPEETFDKMKAVDEEQAIVIQQISQLASLFENRAPRDRTMSFKLATQTRELLNSLADFRMKIEACSSEYEHLGESQVRRFKKTELILMTFTLLILLLEALYVFRPAVEGLYQALRIRSDFLGRMSHELRNPMNAIMGMANLLGDTPVTGQQRNYLNVLRRSSSTLLEILNNLLDFSSMEARRIQLEKISFDLVEVLERAIDLSVHVAQANGTELILDLERGTPVRLTGDPVRLQQVLSNLLGNSSKFTKNGSVTLRVSKRGTDGSSALDFSVQDTGIGIDADKMRDIFRPFVQEDSTVRRRFGGSGLGLTISKELVQLMGGELKVDSKKDHGSKFYFSLPVQTAPGEAQVMSFGAVVEQERFEPFEAAVLEPNEKMFLNFQSFLDLCGGKTTRLAKPAETVVFLQGAKEGMRRLAVLDYDAIGSGLDGLIREIKNAGINTDRLIVAVKSTAPTENVELAISFGVKNILFKPVKPFQFLDLLHSALAEQSAASRKKLETQALTKTAIPRDDRALRILCADDSKENQFLIEAYCRATPYRLTFAEDGQVAYDLFTHGNFDLVLMDIQMPRVDGLQCTQMIRQWEKAQHRPATPIVAVTAHDNQKSAQVFDGTAGFTSHLVKPISASSLRRKVIEVTHAPAAETPQAQSGAVSVAEIEALIFSQAPAYLKNRKNELEQAKQNLSTENFKALEMMGHKIKGNAATYGFPELGVLGGALEEASRNKDRVRAASLILNIESFICART